jgi:hypothetical protein
MDIGQNIKMKSGCSVHNEYLLVLSIGVSYW